MSKDIDNGSSQPHPATLGELTRLVEGTLHNGDPEFIITGPATIEEARPDEITWANNPSMVARMPDCSAGAILIRPDFPKPKIPAILTADPDEAMARVLARFEVPQSGPPVGIHSTAEIGPGAWISPEAAIGAHVSIGAGTRVGAGTRIYAGTYIGRDCVLGAMCSIYPNTYIADRTRIGDRVMIKSSATIGSDGFGFMFRKGGHQRIPQIGHVEIADDVEIGAGSCIDRGKFGATRIGKGTKIDNLVQVAHNCQIGPHCVIVSLVGIAGSCTLGTGVILGGQAGLFDNVKLADGVSIAARAMVTKQLLESGKYAGQPAQPLGEYQRATVAQRHVPKLIEQIKALTKRVTELESAVHDKSAG